MIKEVSIMSKDDILRLNQVAIEQSFDMSVSHGSIIVDARSLLALFTMIGKKVHIVAPDEINPKYFSKIIKRMKLS